MSTDTDLRKLITHLTQQRESLAKDNIAKDAKLAQMQKLLDNWQGEANEKLIEENKALLERVEQLESPDGMLENVKRIASAAEKIATKLDTL